jgi:hypothetical protein
LFAAQEAQKTARSDSLQHIHHAIIVGSVDALPTYETRLISLLKSMRHHQFAGINEATGTWSSEFGVSMSIHL